MSIPNLESIQSQLKAIGFGNQGMALYVWHDLNGRKEEAQRYLEAERARLAEIARLTEAARILQEAKDNEPIPDIKSIE